MQVPEREERAIIVFCRQTGYKVESARIRDKHRIFGKIVSAGAKWLARHAAAVFGRDSDGTSRNIVSG